VFEAPEKQTHQCFWGLRSIRLPRSECDSTYTPTILKDDESRPFAESLQRILWNAIQQSTGSSGSRGKQIILEMSTVSLFFVLRSTVHRTRIKAGLVNFSGHKRLRQTVRHHLWILIWLVCSIWAFFSMSAVRLCKRTFFSSSSVTSRFMFCWRACSNLFLWVVTDYFFPS